MKSVLLDHDIREPLFAYFEDQYEKVRFLEEIQTGRSRADVVMVLPDRICGIEIKSDADGYSRLKTQVKDYDMRYDENYLVVGSTHAWHAEEHVPAHWGIISVELINENVDFRKIRDAGINPNLNFESKMRILWKRELFGILEKNNMPKYRQKGKWFIIEKILNKVDLEALNIQICEELFERDYTL